MGLRVMAGGSSFGNTAWVFLGWIWGRFDGFCRENAGEMKQGVHVAQREEMCKMVERSLMHMGWVGCAEMRRACCRGWQMARWVGVRFVEKMEVVEHMG